MAKAPHRPRVAVSSCLLGSEVRYGGGHRRDAWLVEQLGPHVEWIPLCPETESGLGVPREPFDLHLVGRRMRAITRDSNRDITDRLAGWIKPCIGRLRDANVAAVILKARSPSCGVGSTPLLDGPAEALTDGLFAAAVRAELPEVVLVDDSALEMPAGRRELLRRLGIGGGRSAGNREGIRPSP